MITNIAFLLVACEADNAFIPTFLRCFRRVWPDAPIYLGAETDDNPLYAAHLPRVETTRWSSGGFLRADGVLDCMSQVAELTGKEYVGKLDCDVIHKDAAWAARLADGFPAVGHQHHIALGRFLGFCYALDSSLIPQIREGLKEIPASSLGGEDIAVSGAVRHVFPNGIYLHPSGEGRRYCGIKPPSTPLSYYDDYGYIHCGQGLPTRAEQAARMEELANELGL